MAQGRVLVVEDEMAQRIALEEFLVERGYEVSAAGTGADALEALRSSSYAVLVTDLRLPDLDGLEIIRQARARDDALGVLLVTAFASVESAIEALRLGANDYLLKPLILEDVARKVDQLITHQKLVRENAGLRRALRELRPVTDIVAISPAMQEVVHWAERAAVSTATVLITGQTGTGKEVVARAIHQLGPRRDEPFLAINVAALPETMIESALFGHVKGAFTGADAPRDGLLRAAGEGTVMLDEIGELSPPVQAKLLRTLEAGELQPLGHDDTEPFLARVIAATHRDLEARVESGAFREDLFYRLNVLRIHVPPLRERPEDIPALAEHLLARLVTARGLPLAPILPEAMRALCQHPWRGNVRELANVLERALMLADDGVIGIAQLPEDVRGAAEVPSLALRDAVERFERAHIAMVLQVCDENRERAAHELGLSQATLYRRLEKLGLKRTRRLQSGSAPSDS